MLLSAALAPGARAAAPSPRRNHQQVRLQLLEFLGESDPAGHGGRSEGSKWMVYLSQLNLGNAKPVAPAPAKAQTSVARPPAKHKAPG